MEHEGDIGEVVVKELRRQIEAGRQEEALPSLEAAPFDPVMKIASVLSRTKVTMLLRYFADDDYRTIMSGPRRTLYWPEEDPHEVEMRRPFYNDADFSLFEYLGSGLRRLNQSGELLMGIIANAANAKESLHKIALMRVRQTYLFPKREAFDNDAYQKRHEFRIRRRRRGGTNEKGRKKGLLGKEWAADELTESRKPLEELANSVALQLYEKLVIDYYHQHFGIPRTRSLKLGSFDVKEKPEGYQSPAQALLPLDPKAVMAANAFYSHFESFEKRFAKIDSIFNLVLVAAIDLYAERTTQPKLRRAIQAEVDGPKNLEAVFYRTILLHHLSEAGKLK